MMTTNRRAGPWCAGLVTLGLVGCALDADPERMDDTDQDPAAYVEIVVPQPPGGVSTGPEPEPGDCTTGCSLAHHPIPPFGRGDFAKARYQYAAEAPTAAGESLEQLLFYPTETRFYLDEMGPGPLSPEHVAYLEQQLTRDHAVVSIRLVDDAGQVRVAYGPERVPIGIKQHLSPVLQDLQPLEFNGTVLRTGVEHLWSRY
jgi:hypothetical protein